MEKNTKLNQPKAKDNSKPFLLICPYCLKCIPYLVFKPSQSLFNIEINCSCLLQSKSVSLSTLINTLQALSPSLHQCSKHTSKAEKYCTICSLWLCSKCITNHSTSKNNHLLYDYELQIQCNQHSKSFSHYCKQCKMHLCPNCITNHSKHILVPIHFQFKEIDITAIDEILEKNKSDCETFLRLIESVNNCFQLYPMIFDVFEKNEMINKNLRLLYLSLKQLFSTFTMYPLYELLKLRTIQINTIEFIITYFNDDIDLTLEKDLQRFINHLEFNFALIQKPIDESIFTINEGFTSLIQLNNEQLLCSTYKTVASLNIVTKEITKLSLNNCSINCIVKLNNESVVCGSRDAVIQIWDLATNKCVASLINNESLSCLMQLNEKTLVSGSQSALIQIWNLTTNEIVVTLSGHSNLVSCLTNLTDGRFASGSYDNTIKIWNTVTNQCVDTLLGHLNFITCLLRLTDGRLASGSYDKCIKIWNVMTNQCTTTFKSSCFMKCLVQLVDGRIAFESEKKICLFDNNKYNGELCGHINVVHCLIQLTDGRLLSSTNNEMKVWYI